MSSIQLVRLAMTLTALSGTALAEPGLFSVDDAQLPPAIRSSVSAVFNIIPLARQPRIVPSADYDAEVKKRTVDGIYGALITQEIERCRASKRDSCAIVYKGSGTAFLAGDGRTLWSVRHNFDAQIQERQDELGAGLSIVEKHKAVLYTAPGFLLFDADGKKLFDTRNTSDVAQFSFIGNPKLVDFGIKQGSDIAILSLSRSIDRTALTVAPEVPTAKDPVFIVGFPTKTFQRAEKHGVPDADGATIRVSKGKNLTAAAGFFAYMANQHGSALSVEDAAQLDSMFLFFDADGVPGQSGAPLLDGQGRIVGIFSTHCIADGAEAPEDSYCQHGGFGPHVKWVDGIKAEYDSALNRALK